MIYYYLFIIVNFELSTIYVQGSRNRIYQIVANERQDDVTDLEIQQTRTNDNLIKHIKIKGFRKRHMKSYLCIQEENGTATKYIRLRSRSDGISCCFFVSGI